MTGIVLVSHSRAVARAVAEFVQHVVPDEEIPVAYAGGVSGSDEGLGTDPTDIMNAIESVFSPDGVIVFVDIGSAILSTDMAMELLGDRFTDRVVVSSAPMIEGAVSAAVQAAAGLSLTEIRDEVLGALASKQQQLGESDSEPADLIRAQDDHDRPSSIKRVFVINLLNGLHARPAARIVRTVGRYDCTVTVSNLSNTKGPVSGRSLNQLSTLEVAKGHEVLVVASGTDAAAVLEAIGRLVEENFGEGEDLPPRRTRKQRDGTVCLSDGIALGRAWVLDEVDLEIPERLVENSDAEVSRFRKAVETAKRRIAGHAGMVGNRTNAPEAEIFEAHLVLLEDPDLIEATVDSIVENSWGAEYAWSRSVRVVLQRYESLEDAYLQVRATDVTDIGIQVLGALGVGPTAAAPEFEGPIVVVARELTPSQTVSLDLTHVCGLVTETGGPTSHTAILARALGIPAVGGYPGVSSIRSGDELGIDGFSGVVYREIDDEIRRLLIGRRDSWMEERERLRKAAEQPSVTLDGQSYPILANIGTPADVPGVIRNGAEGVGLLRTELLFLNRTEAPSLEEQLAYFKEIFGGMDDLPVTVRTFDIGGDKQIPYLNMEAEENPFLGVRGIRLYEHNMSLFETQIEAILRSAIDHNVSIMFPMVAKLEEYTMAEGVVRRVHDRLVALGVAHKWPIELGVMIETPASVLVAEDLAGVVGFFSIGTNDLTQYVLAAERGSRRLAGFLDSLEPSVLRAVKTIADIGRAHGISVSVCGELGAQIEAVPLLIGLGVDKISANGESIPAIKDAVRRTNRSRVLDLSAELVQNSKSAHEIKSRLGEFIV